MICNHCGYKNIQNIDKCIVCGGEISSVKLSKKEISDMVDKLADKGDKLIPSNFEVIFKWICFGLAFIVLMFLLILSQFLLLAFATFSIIALAGVIAGYPRIVWSIEKEFLNIRIRETDITPTEIWSLGRKITYWLFFVLGIGLAVFDLLLQ